MRIPGVLLAALALASQVAAEPPSMLHLQAQGFGVVAVIHHTDEAGVLTEGYIFGLNVLHGAQPDVPYDRALAFFGTRFFPDLGYAVPFTGAAPAAYAAHGLQGGTVVGTVVAEPFYDGSNLPPDPLPPITIAVDLTWEGTGATHGEVTHYAESSPGGQVYVLVAASRWRYADIGGDASVNGEPAAVDLAQVLAESAGELNLVVLH